MWRTFSYCVLGMAAALSLASCATTPYFTARNEPWRKDAEVSCLRAGVVQESAFIAGRSSLIAADGLCGAVHPFQVAAVGHGAVGLRPNALVQCQMVPALDAWVDQVVIPAAHRVYGVGLAEMRVLASYSCRPMNNVYGAHLSEHGHANAVDIGAFTLTNGRTISVASGWNGSSADRFFLRTVHDGACETFSTVLGPNANAQHHDHFHLDLMPRHVGKGICE
jgi:hypothetical protein